MEEHEKDRKIAELFKRMIKISTEGMHLHCGDCFTPFIVEIVPTVIKSEEGLPIFGIILVCKKCDYDLNLLNETIVSSALEIELKKPLGDIVGEIK